MLNPLVQIEASLNSGPLTPISNDINDEDAPGHFLTGYSLMTFSQETSSETLSANDQWQLIDRIVGGFWKTTRLLEFHSGVDGIVRVAAIKLKGRVTKRAVTNLCPSSIPYPEISEQSSFHTDNEEEIKKSKETPTLITEPSSSTDLHHSIQGRAVSSNLL